MNSSNPSLSARHVVAVTLTTVSMILLVLGLLIVFSEPETNSSITRRISFNLRNPRSAPTSALVERIPTSGPPDQDHTEKQKRAILTRVRAVAQLCGQLCDTTRDLEMAEVYPLDTKDPQPRLVEVATAHVQCSTLLTSEDIDAPRETTDAPKTVMSELYNEFTTQGRAKVFESYTDYKYLGSATRKLIWNETTIEEYKRLALQGELKGTYNLKTTQRLMRYLNRADLHGKRTLVVGSQYPWVEACVLAAGAKEVVTLEYSTIVSTHPQITAMVPSVFAAKYLAGDIEPFDLVVSFSSLEHSGLGRYGDALNPWGDIISVAKIWCVTKPGALFIIDVPIGQNDALVYNAHRVYGPIRMPYLMANWVPVNSIPEEKVFIHNHGTRIYRRR